MLNSKQNLNEAEIANRGISIRISSKFLKPFFIRLHFVLVNNYENRARLQKQIY